MSWRVSAESYCFNWFKSLRGAADRGRVADTTGSKALIAAQPSSGQDQGCGAKGGCKQIQHQGATHPCPLPPQLLQHILQGSRSSRSQHTLRAAMGMGGWWLCWGGKGQELC